MLGGSVLPPLDLLALLQFVVTALALASGLLFFVKYAASRYFVVDANFEADSGFEDRERSMSIGGGGDDEKCFVCGRPGPKNCSRCKSVRYCSLECQAKHWKEEHKLNCKNSKLSNNMESVSLTNSACRRRNGFSPAIALVPARGTCKVLERPKKILFPYDDFVKLFNWNKQVFPPCGLLNCGNSCFANVVLQCLACTQPLIAYLLEGGHARGCSRRDWCFLCELQIHVQKVSQSLQPFSPINILSRLPNIGGNLGYGRQEDAHEFMRFAIDTMQSICLDEFGGEKALDPSTQETTLIHHIFGGFLQSQVICTNCNMISNRYENMMDLTVEIQGDVESLEDCLDQFTVKEWLDGENMYKCDGCNAYVKAWKRLTVHQAPNILTIALKRFQSGRFGKLNKRVTFPEILDLGPYMSGAGDGTDVYTLYAVVVHVDMLNASFFGHYICYTKDFQGHWYRIDDCKVMKVEVEEVLAQGAYMLLYRRTSARQPFVKPLEPMRKKGQQSVQMDHGLKRKEGPEDMDMDEPVKINLGPATQDSGDVDMDVSELISLESNDLDGNPIHLLPSVMSSTGAQTAGCHRPCFRSHVDSQFEEENGSRSNSEKLSQVADSRISVALNSAPEISEANPPPSNCYSGPETERTMAVGGESDSTSENVGLASEVRNRETKALTSCRENGTHRGKSKPMFSPGFLNKPARKKSVCREERAKLENGEVLSSKYNGNCNGLCESDNNSQGKFKSSISALRSMPEPSGSRISIAGVSSVPELLKAKPSLPHNFSGPKLEQIEAVSGPLDSANGVTRLGDMSPASENQEIKFPSSSSDYRTCRGEPKPLFFPGFLDKRAETKSLYHEEKTQIKNSGVFLSFRDSDNCNGSHESDNYSCNGKLNPQSSPGFLDKHGGEKTLDHNEKRLKENGAGLSCKDNRNCNGCMESGLVHQNVHDHDASRESFCGSGKDILPDFDMPLIHRGFLDKSNRKARKKDQTAKKDVDKNGHLSRIDCDGFADPIFLGKDHTPETSSNGYTSLDCEKPFLSSCSLDGVTTESESQ